MGSKKSTRKQFVIIGIVLLIVCVGLSGCNQISNVFLTDKDKLVGTWNTNGIWLDVPTVIVFSSNGTFKIDVGIPNSPINFSLNEGKWNMNDRILTMEIVGFIPLNNYTYKFSEDNKTLEITEVNSSGSYILRKQ
jgi:hypothetical protein